MLKLLGNPWVLLGLLVAFAIYTAVIYRSAYGEGKADCEFAQQQAVIAEQKRRAEENARLTAADAIRAVIHKAEIDALEAQLAAIPDNPNACLDASAADRLRRL